ncbi:methionyl-tRNA formyltransferase [Patescibacteria group bacterium]|nr:methionyl-tRNA formyltransferase [Patescibacteria group bacterium]
MSKKALVLLSGGLDSSLAAYLIKKQGIKVKALVFQSYFFGPEKGVAAAEQLKIPYQIVDFSKEHLKIVKNPKHGHGKAINPCIDCHLLMIKTAKKILEKENFDFVATGEVLGQRPFSQNKQALLTIAKESNLKGRLVRPLSAKLLATTLPEKKGWIKKEGLFDIRGRSRKRQTALAEKIGLKFPQPAGGCLLTEIEFAKKLKLFLKKKPGFSGNDAQLSKLGRHFWFGKKFVVLGRNQDENAAIEKLAMPKDLLILPANFPGPSALIRAEKTDKDIAVKTKKKILSFSKKDPVIKTGPIIFFGSSNESVLVLKKLLEEKIPIGLAITKPDRPAGRGQKITAVPIAEFCQKEKITVLKWEKLDQEALKKTEKKLRGKPVLAITAVYGNFIPQFWLDWCNMVINLHPSLIPKWRGAAPVIRSIEAGDKITGVTILRTVKEMDAGPVVDQVEVKIKSGETAGELISRLFEIGAERLAKLIKANLLSRKPLFWINQPQDHNKATWAKKIEKEEAGINWQEPAEKILDKIRAFNPQPGAFTFAKAGGNKKRLKIWKAHLSDSKSTPGESKPAPGESFNSSIRNIIELGKRVVIPDIVQLEGKDKQEWEAVKNNLEIIKK